MEHVVGFRPAAVIFDMDGVLADTEPSNEKAIAVVLSGRGGVLSDREYGALVGQSNDESWAWLIDRFGLTDEVAQLQSEYVRAVLPLLGTTRPGPGVMPLVEGLRAAGTRLALASSSPRAAIEAVLGALGLSEAFEAVVSGEDVAAGKPAPDIFLRAAAELQVSPRQCVVIEDSPHGLEGARRAGMHTIALRTRYTAGMELLADIVIDSLETLAAE
ncbi:MAG: HAD family phosphatase [Chloroflexota bacterium]